MPFADVELCLGTIIGGPRGGAHGAVAGLSQIKRDDREGPLPAVQPTRPGSKLLGGVAANLEACKVPEQQRVGIIGDVDGVPQVGFGVGEAAAVEVREAARLVMRCSAGRKLDRSAEMGNGGVEILP